MPDLDPIQSSSTTAAGDPNFHDIKPLPQFSPIPWNYLYLLIGLLALLALFYRLRKLWRQERVVAPAPIVPPLEAALNELALLDGARRRSEISVRELCSHISLLLRLYLEKRLSFPAVEQTTAEVQVSFPPVLARKLPLLSKERHISLSGMCRTLLRNLERYTFGTNSAETLALQGAEISALFPAAETLLRELDSLLEREAERTRSVVELEKS